MADIRNFETELLIERTQEDEINLSDAFISLTEVVEGKRALTLLGAKKNFAMAENAIEDILAYLGCPEKVDLEAMSGKNDSEIMEELGEFFYKRGFSILEARLEKGWSKKALGPMLLNKKDGDIAALVPDQWGRYHFLDFSTGKKVAMTKNLEEEFEESGILFLRQFDRKRLSKRDLLFFMMKSFTRADYISVILFGLAATMVSMITPDLIDVLFSNASDYTSISPIMSFFVFMVCTTVSVTLFRIVQTQMIYRMAAKLDRDSRAATIERMLSLPTDFFKKHSTGELAKRIQIFPMLCNSLVLGVFTTGLMMVLGLIYIAQVYQFGQELVMPVTVIVIAYLFLTYKIVKEKSRVNSVQIEYATKDNALLVSMMSGIQTLKVTSSEKRMYTEWLKIFKKEAMTQFRPGFWVVYGNVFFVAISMIGTLGIYFVANERNMFPDSYLAFTAVYAMLTAVFLNVQEVIPEAAKVIPILESIDVFFMQEPEQNETSELQKVVPGRIEFDNVSFKYEENLPLVIKDFNLTIKEGEYVAIVGKSGCGKSTLMRLLLGFETCSGGNLYINGINMKNVDKKTLRRQFGVVMQDSKLFAGSIYKNISISNPGMSEEEAWKAAEKAGIAEDIRNMPMKMDTLVDENASCISGGQRQRIIIARALAGNPKLVLFDEATSALDNITQKIVSDSLDALDCTRIVIAHRLSTIKNCDRIIMIEDGTVAETGTYDELMAMNGKFAALVERQKL